MTVFKNELVNKSWDFKTNQELIERHNKWSNETQDDPEKLMEYRNQISNPIFSSIEPKRIALSLRHNSMGYVKIQIYLI